MIAYLDTNVFDHLYKKIGCTSANIAELRTLIYGRGLSMPIGIHVLEEILLNRRASPQELVARVKLTLSLASIRRMVKPCDQLLADDIRSYAATGQPDRNVRHYAGRRRRYQLQPGAVQRHIGGDGGSAKRHG